MTTIVCISDTHTYHDHVVVPPGDILVHAGDFCGRGTPYEVSRFLDWMEGLPHKLKLVVPGNHDICVYEDEFVRSEFKKSGVILLIDEEHTDMRSGLTFYGVPWTPDFYPENWVFQYSQAGCTPEELWNKVPAGTDIIISHGPPHGCADQIAMGAPHLGSPYLRDLIFDMKDSLLGVICGHIHGGYGHHSYDATDPTAVNIINAAINTEGYTPTNKPLVWEVL